MKKIKTDQLNKAQIQAVLHGDSPLLVIAGAGSGKTRVVTHRVAHLIQRGFSPSRLFVTTFTNKAAEEMKERLVPMIGERRSERLRIGTFHSLCRKILIDLMKEEVRRFENPRLFKGGTRFFVMKGAFKKAGLDDKRTKFALEKISYWKNDGRTIEEAAKEDSFYAQYYALYQEHLIDNNLIDFDDMLFRTYYELIKPKNRDFLEGVVRRIDHIIVDEGQDLNRIQFMLTKLLAGEKKNVTLVADDWQVLYSFRGAAVQHIHQFIADFKPEMVKLERNYRSTKIIVNTGNRLIGFNKGQIDKVLYTENEEGDKPNLLIGFDADEEAQHVFDQIERLVVEHGFELNDICILYRTNAQSRAIVDIFVKNSIPHKVHSKYGFYDRAEIKDIVTYVRIVSNPFAAELEDFRRIINRPTRFLGKAFIDSIEEYQIENGSETFWEAMRSYIASDAAPFQQSRAGQKFVEDIMEINNWIFLESDAGRPPTTADVINKVLEVIPYQEWAIKEDEESEEEPDNDRKLNIDSLMAGASRFPSTEDFFFFLDSMANRKDEDEDDVVHLMTIHKSKGTEYPVVFVIGCCEKILPHFRVDDVEEERRCAYVAVTRAKEKLFLCMIHGKYSRFKVTASRFLTEMGVEIPPLGEIGEGPMAIPTIVRLPPVQKVELRDAK